MQDSFSKDPLGRSFTVNVVNPNSAIVVFEARMQAEFRPDAYHSLERKGVQVESGQESYALKLPAQIQQWLLELNLSLVIVLVIMTSADQQPTLIFMPLLLI